MTPRRVTITRNRFSSKVETGKTAVTFSSSGSVSKLTSAVPRACRVLSGIS